MLHLTVKPKSKENKTVWLICVLLGVVAVHSHGVLSVPQHVTLSPNLDTQQLSISWEGGAATTFDLIILRTEFNQTVFYETVSVTANQVTGLHQWNWTSVEPLECTSLSIKIRSRDGQTTSEWSQTQILKGNDLPDKESSQFYPVDRVVPVGANTTFCCILKEERLFVSMHYHGIHINATRLSRRSYAFTAKNQRKSSPSGSNVFCVDDRGLSAGTVVFIGYSPKISNFACETRDLTSTVCQWNDKDTGLYGKRGPRYFLNNRVIAPVRLQGMQRQYFETQWGGKWTLEAVNSLGSHSVTDTAEITHRVHPVAPINLIANPDAWNATVLWQWKYKNYSSLPLICQVELYYHESKTEFNVSGVGLQSAFLPNLLPVEDYSVRIRCGAQENFWKWGDWSKPLTFKTNMTVPDAPDMWVTVNRNKTVRIIWKPLTLRESHSVITAFEVSLWSLEENVQFTEIVLPHDTSISVNFTQMGALNSDNKIIATIIANSSNGPSPPASVVLPLTDMEPRIVSRVVYEDGGFPLSWQSNAKATCGYVVDWCDAFCTSHCAVDWIKVAAGITNVSIDSVNFQPGVRYNISLYSCSSEATELLQRWQGYVEELVPSSSAPLSLSQEDSDVVLTWAEIPPVNRRGFILGYTVYNSAGSELKLLANLSDPTRRDYTVKGLSGGLHKFTVKAYNSAGENMGTTTDITMQANADWLILEILTSLGVMTLSLVIVTYICYKKRKWVKKAFYPDIPEPKLSGDWSRTPGPLDVKPPSSSIVHIVEKSEWDSSKEALVVIPEEDEDEFEEGWGMGDEQVDTDEPTSLRYYNQVVDERPIRPRFPDSSASSASSLDSARTDVTYTGIQTSGSSLVFQLEPQASSEGHQPHANLPVNCGGGGGGYQPQMQAGPPSGDNMGLASPEPFLEPQAASAGGYKPQSSWHLDSPVEAGESDDLGPSLGSPTSVASTQFLLPEGEHPEEKRQLSSSAATWFTNLLSSTKP